MPWIPIAEQMPPLGAIVFLWDGHSPWIGIRTPSDDDWALVEEPYWSSKKSCWEWNRIELDDLHPTHWHPFPDPPATRADA